MKKTKSIAKLAVAICSAFMLLTGITLVAPQNSEVAYADTHPHIGDITFDNELKSAGGELSGNYYLNDDLSMDSSIIVESGTILNLCLNGHILNLSCGCPIQNFGELNIYDCNTSNEHEGYFNETSDGDGTWTYCSDQSGNKSVSGGVITNGTGTKIALDGDPNNSYCLAGGAVYNVGSLNIYGGSFVGNKVGTELNNYGGAIFCSKGSTLYMENCCISHNGASVDYTDGNGGGIYVSELATELYVPCFPAGTKITMANGTTKNIEDVQEGEIVKTFDHSTGALSTEEVCLAYKGETQECSFTLHFSNNIDLSICGCHDLFEQSSLKYVTIRNCNAKSFIGKYFYNANALRWEQLLSVTYNTEKTDYYSLYTAHHLNCIVNNMLSVPNGANFYLNIYELDANLKLNQAQLDADIEQFGLYAYENVSEAMTNEEYDNFNTKYTNIVVGKGLATIKYLHSIRQGTNEYLETQQDVNALENDLIETDDVNQNITYITFGSNVTVTNNYVYKVNESPNTKSLNNIYLCENCQIQVVSDAEGIEAGITMETPGVFATNYVSSDDKTTIEGTITTNPGFTSDDNQYGVVLNSGLEIGTQGSTPSTGFYFDNSIAILTGGIALVSGALTLALISRKKHN